MDLSMRPVFRTVRACDGHHVIASGSSARRHRQGPKAARMRGRSEAQRLAPCRAQMQHRRRDGRRVDLIPRVMTPATPQANIENAPRLRPRFPGRNCLGARVNATYLRPTFSGRTGPDCPENLGRNGAWSMQQTRGASRRGTCGLPHLKRQRQPWRERPRRTGAGPSAARAPGSLTPCLLL